MTRRISTTEGPSILRHPVILRVRDSAFAIFIVCLCHCSGKREEHSDRGFSVQTLASGVESISHGQLPDLQIGLDTLVVLDIWADEIGYQFSRVAAVVGGDTSIILADGRNLQIVELGLDGTVVRVIGGRGSGPGEFQGLQHIDLFDGELWAVDVISRRYSVFSRSGEFLRSYRWPDSPIRPGPFRAVGDGRILLLSLDMSLDSPLNVMHLVVQDLATGDIDTLASMSAPGYVSIVLQDDDSPLRQVVNTPPVFSPFLQWTFLPGGGVAAAATVAYRIDYLTVIGELIRFMTAPSPDLTVTERDREWWYTVGFFEDQTGRVLDRVGLHPTIESLRTYPFADERQAILDLAADPRGWLWVLAATADPAVNRIDIFDADGRFQGSIQTNSLPRTFLSDGSAVFEAIGSDELFRCVVCRLDLEP